MPIKPDEYTQMVNEVIDFKLQAVKEYIAEKIGPIGDIGSPEKFIGKKAELWTDMDWAFARTVYGVQPGNELNKMIERKQKELVRQQLDEIEAQKKRLGEV